MTTLAAVFQQYGPKYIRKYHDKIPGIHLKVIQDISRCRTKALGGQVYYCEHCHQYHYSYHSCGNRHCNQCQSERSQQWLEDIKSLHLPVSHFLLTFTLHGNLRSLDRKHPKLFYNLLFTCAAKALQKLASDFKYLGGTLGMMGILHIRQRRTGSGAEISLTTPMSISSFPARCSTTAFGPRSTSIYCLI